MARNEDKPVILIVDDEPVNQSLLAAFLEPEYVVRGALCGEEALNIIFSENGPDLVLLDVMLPDLDGYEVCRRMRSDERACAIPVIYITAMGRGKNEMKGFEAGAVDYITKPFSPEVVRARVRTHMELKKHRDTLEQMVGERTALLAEANALLEREVEERRTARRELQAAHDQLEERVRERTFELEKANLQLVHQVSEREKVEKELKREKGFIGSILENSFDGIAVVTPSGRVRFISPGMERIFGYSADEMPTVAAWAKLVFPDESVRNRALSIWMDDVNRAEPTQRIFSIVNRAGEERWCRMQVSRMPEGDIVLNGQDVTELKRAEERIRYMALHDHLTGLPNRQLFEDRLALALSQAKRRKTMVGLLYVDLDRFKEINDVYGHQVGDRVLREAGNLLLTCVRESDTVARIGGDEFVVVLPDLADRSEAEMVADRISETLFQTRAGDETLLYGASVGISLYPKDASDSSSLIQVADRAMYESKSRMNELRLAVETAKSE